MAKLTCFLAGVILVGIMAQAAAEEGCMATWTLRDLDQQEERDGGRHAKDVHCQTGCGVMGFPQNARRRR